jgi:hypothetical protein
VCPLLAIAAASAGDATSIVSTDAGAAASISIGAMPSRFKQRLISSMSACVMGAGSPSSSVIGGSSSGMAFAPFFSFA